MSCEEPDIEHDGVGSSAVEHDGVGSSTVEVVAVICLVFRTFAGFVQSNTLGTAPRFKSLLPVIFLSISSGLKWAEQTTVFAVIYNKQLVPVTGMVIVVAV